jgi:amidase
MSVLNQSAIKLTDELRTGKLSAQDLMRATLDRINTVNGTLNAIVSMRDADSLMADARACDQGDVRGPLHGLPFAVKDTASAAGFVTSVGSPILADNMAVEDDIAVGRIRAAGAIVIGKTNVPEFGLGSHTVNRVFGPTCNPYDITKSCGGSSGGASVALATGMVALADGSDIMGSLRNPAAWNNIYGMRPSWSVVPLEPRGDTFLSQLAAMGPMARSPEDIALLLDIMAGPDPRQPHGAPLAPVNPLTPTDLTGKRIGWLGDWGGAFPTEEGILPICESALGTLSDLGADVIPVAPPFSSEALWDSWVTLRWWEATMRISVHKDKMDQLGDKARWELENGLALSAMEVHRASSIRSEWFAKAHRLFQSFDALVLPSAQVWPFDINIPYPTEIAGKSMDTYHRWMEVVIPPSLIGLPCLAMPAGFGANGLPMGIQIFGARGSDAALLGIGAAYHAATEWPQKRPALK